MPKAKPRTFESVEDWAGCTVIPRDDRIHVYYPGAAEPYVIELTPGMDARAAITNIKAKLPFSVLQTLVICEKAEPRQPRTDWVV